MPSEAAWPPAPPADDVAREPEPVVAELAPESSLADAVPRREAPWREDVAPAQPADSFDAVWPPEDRERRAVFETIPEPAAAAPVPEDSGPEPMDQAYEPAEPPPRPAILKSGVIDGMAYTLYADGSIEAELAAGTVRFASINELRAHLDANG
jgi:hypothetical protein